MTKTASPIGVSIPAVKAFGEALAWPMVSTEALRSGRYIIDSEAESPRFRERLRAYGGAEAAPEHLRLAWPKGRDIIAGLRDHARCFLLVGHDGWRLSTDPTVPGREILRWRYISLCLPVGTLVAAATPRLARPRLRVDILPHSIAPRESIAHLHVHVGAAWSFEGLWSNFVSRRIPESRAFWSSPKGTIKLPQGIDRDEWLGLLTRAALVRRILMLMGLDWALGAHESIERAYGKSDEIWLIQRAVDELACGQIMEITNLREARLHKIAAAHTLAEVRDKNLRSVDDLWRLDAIGDGRPWPEGRMMALIFERLEDKPDPQVSQLFVQYLRVKSMLYRLLVQDPVEKGLRSFDQTFTQKGPYQLGIESLLPDFCLDEPAIQLRALEVRTAPPQTTNEARRLCKNLTEITERRATKTQSPIEVGWIFHFIRTPKNVKAKSTGARYCSLYKSMRRSASVLHRALRARPWELLPVIRGLDIAGVEREGPLWVALPHLIGLRELSVDICARTDLAPLHFTLHVGEDFLHLASGLRAVHEPFLWGLMQRGDRLGHALALGLDAERWCEGHRVVVLPRWERILDLSWMIAALTNRLPFLRIPVDLPGLMLARVYEELRVHSEASNLGADLGAFIELFTRDLGDKRSLPRLLELGYTPGPGEPLYILHQRLHGSAAVQERLDMPVEVDTSGEGRVLAVLSDEIARTIGLMQITIEVNPTSNLLIGGFEHPLEQPLFRLHPLDGNDGNALPVTLNADDPLTFATCLSDEIAYTWAALTLAAGVSPGYARAWIEEAARASWNARFTLPRRA